MFQLGIDNASGTAQLLPAHRVINGSPSLADRWTERPLIDRRKHDLKEAPSPGESVIAGVAPRRSPGLAAHSKVCGLAESGGPGRFSHQAQRQVSAGGS